MVEKEQWVVLLYLVAKAVLGLSLIPLGVQEERNQRPWCLVDYSLSHLNSKTFPIATMSAMQYGRDIERLIGDVVISDPALGRVHVLKADFSDVSCRI